MNKLTNPLEIMTSENRVGGQLKSISVFVQDAIEGVHSSLFLATAETEAQAFSEAKAILLDLADHCQPMKIAGSGRYKQALARATKE